MRFDALGVLGLRHARQPLGGGQLQHLFGSDGLRATGTELRRCLLHRTFELGEQGTLLLQGRVLGGIGFFRPMLTCGRGLFGGIG